MIRRLYPGGKRKALNFSYDDGVVQDVRFVALLNQYGLKGTFNLNSKLLLDGLTWVHPCGKTITRLPKDQIVSLYEGHEIASHTATHPMMQNISEEEIMEEMVSDKQKLEEIFGREVVGFALPFSYHDEKIYRCSMAAGFEYARISEVNPDFSIPEDLHRWKSTLFHLDDRMDETVDAFLNTDKELALFQPIGHSYDLDVHEKWEWFENILQKLHGDDSVWSATHIEIVRYLRQMENLIVTEKWIQNDSDVDLWVEIGGKVNALHPGDKEEIK